MPLDACRSTEQVDLLIPAMTCAGCMTRVEQRLTATPGVVGARANLTRHTVSVRIDQSVTDAEALVAALDDAGYAARPFDASMQIGSVDDRTGRALLLRIGVAGFAAMNVMLLSISVWSGADGAMRDLLHWVSALIALPTIVYAGTPFFRSAVAALSRRRLNMDVPISLAIVLATVSSVLETSRSGEHAYFDAGVMLIFFLLVGRYLEHRTRAAARTAAAELTAMTGRTALQVMPDGTRTVITLDALTTGMVIEIAPGERIPADGQILSGQTALDRSLVTGESLPEPAEPGTDVHAGMLNLTGAIQVRVDATGDATLLAEIARMVDSAERGRSRHDRIADRAARIYAPAVHIVAAAAFAGWLWATGSAWTALQIATAVLIVTCPCALALAVPTVHTVASGRLFRRGIFLKDGAELERLAEIDMVVFDKTGTLTDGEPRLVQAPPADDPAWPVAAALARVSRHPLSNAIAAEAERLGITPVDAEVLTEHPGLGVEAIIGGQKVRLGRPSWAGGSGHVALSGGGVTASFAFAEALRPEVAKTCDALRADGLDLAILSGDTEVAVRRVADETGIGAWHAALMPGEKLDFLTDQAAAGRRVLMVGDGLNDSPALAGAHASISPAAAADVAKTAAGAVFTGHGLMAVATALRTARVARRRAYQSFGIALVYNAIAIPLAMAGLITPLIAALAMSSSSILVVLNALRQESPS